jgi:hypothetical protein
MIMTSTRFSRSCVRIFVYTLSVANRGNLNGGGECTSKGTELAQLTINVVPFDMYSLAQLH